MSELNLILLGPPGAGKGTQAERLQEDFPLAYVATGDMLRQAVKDETDLGKEAKAYMDRGDLVPDEIIIGVILDRLAEPDTADGFLLDGFPRTDEQAKALDEALRKVDRRLNAALLITRTTSSTARRRRTRSATSTASR
jgi:adenylate kinase